MRSWPAAVAVVIALGVGACADSSDPGPTSTTAASDDGATSTTRPEFPDGSTDTVLDLLVVTVEEVATLDQPTHVVARSGTPDLYVAERPGRIQVVEVDEDERRGTVDYDVARRPVLDITDDVGTDGLEQGLLGITFSPDGRRLYVDYTDPDGTTVLAEYTMERDRVDEGSRRELLRVEQPFQNHNGGHLAFGPDGFLYVGLGDGGSGDDPGGNGQDPATLLGSIVRIDPEAGGGDFPYGIPDGNPWADGSFAGRQGRAEVFVWGVRNPWRFTFDPATADLWIADVGQGEWEEITRLSAADAAGANLGWNGLEGTHDGVGDVPDDHVLPVYEYDHDSGCSVTGGRVYRGERVPGAAGIYVYGDYCEGRIRTLLVEDGVAVDARTHDAEVPDLASFGVDRDGELWATSLSGGLYRVSLGAP